MDGLVEIFLFCGVLYYFFNSNFNFRANNMLDVLSTRLQEVYAKWENKPEVMRNTEPTTNKLSLEGLRRACQQFQRKNIQDKERSKAYRDYSLFMIKETELRAPPIKQKSSFFYYCCEDCTPHSRNSLVNAVSNEQQQPYGLNILVVNPCSTVLSKLFCYISHVYNCRYHHYPRVTQTVLNDERLQKAIKSTASENVSKDGSDEKSAFAKARARAETILLQMESKISNTLLKITAWLLYKLLPCFIQSAIVLPSQLEMLKKANETGLPLILLPLHRSHLDYIMISFLLLVNNIRNPLIAAGDNLKIPFFGWLLRGLGAFFIKRRIDPAVGHKDVLYRAILHTYVMENLRAGHNLEFFLEGGRTRTGKPCMPKGGILSVIIDAWMDGTIHDALLVPVAINYERLVDGNFVREQLGQPKKMETFGTAIKAIWSTLMGNYGIVKINFCQPFSLAEMVMYFQARQQTLSVAKSSSPLYGTDVVVKEEDRQLVDNIARHVVYDCTRSMPIMSTNVVAFLLLNRFRDGCTLDMLVEAFDSIRQELEWSHKDIAFCGENIDIVNHALEILGPGLVKQQRQDITEVDDQIMKSKVVTAIRPVSVLPNVIELSYYSNTMLLHYVMDSVVVTALYAELQSQINDPVAIAQDNIKIFQDCLVRRALHLCNILRYEFIFCKPCQLLKEVVIETIQKLSHIGIISLEEEAYLDEELWSRRYAQNFDDSSDEEYSRTKKSSIIQYKLSLVPEDLKRMEFLHTLLRPLVDTYTFSAFTLKKLVSRSLAETDLVHEILREIKANVDLGVISYGESLCVDPIKNSLKLFEKWDVLECYLQENIKIFYLSDLYDTDVRTEEVYQMIAPYKWTSKTN